MKLLAIDPGKHKCYGAWFDGGVLRSLHTWPIDFEKPFLSCPNPTRIVLEKPTYKTNGNTQGARGNRRPNDLIDLAASGFWLAAQFRAPITVRTPEDWKKQAKKPPHHRAIWEDVLSPFERDVFPADTYDYILAACKHYARTGSVAGYSAAVTNHLDAAALGVTELKRCRPGGNKI